MTTTNVDSIKCLCDVCAGRVPFDEDGYHQCVGPVAAVEPAWRRGLTEHVERFLGGPITFLHETRSSQVHIDVMVVPASDERPYHTLVTAGISDKRCKTPDDMRDYRFIELMTYLPPDWDLRKLTASREYYWPVAMLRSMGRLVHEERSHYGPGHTYGVEAGAPPFVEGSLLDNALILTPFAEAAALDTLKIRRRRCRFLWALPITAAELQYKQRYGTCELLERMDRERIYIEPYRPCAVTGREVPLVA